MSMEAGQSVRHYRLVEKIGEGGMGVVWKATDTTLDRSVAVKFLPAHLSEDAGALARFEREAKVVAALAHPNILSIHDFGVQDGRAYAVVELLEGETLRQKLAEGPLPVRRAVDYASQIARGLSAAHDKGIVHRDLKPENVIVGRDGLVKILDFGLASPPSALAEESDSHVPTAAPLTEPGSVMGTVGYMSPEQVRGRAADHRSDIFSLGAILYEMLAGQRAFRGDSAVETMNAILREEPPELVQADKALPPALDRIVQHCLEKDPERRFQSCRDLAFDLETVGGQSSVSGVAQVSPLPGARRRLGWAAVLVATLLAGLGGYVAGRGGSSSEAPDQTTFQRITFRRGNLLRARFAPDGQTIVYAAAWDYQPTDVYLTRATASESRSLGLPGADLLAVSATGEMAVLLKTGDLLDPGGGGTLARVSLSGGTPRQVLEDVKAADWSLDGSDLAVLRRVGGRDRLEYPIGRILYETSSSLEAVRISPSGEQVAVVESAPGAGGSRKVVLVDANGKEAQRVRVLTSFSSFQQGLAWSPDGSELFFTGDDAIEAVSLEGTRRVLLESPEALVLHDVSRDGRLLVESFNLRQVLMWSRVKDGTDRDLSWFDVSSLADLSADGRTLLFFDRGGAYVRRTDGSPAVRLGPGRPTALSPDGEWALTAPSDGGRELTLLPTGPGEVKTIDTGEVEPISAAFLPDGSGILWVGSTRGQGVRLYVQDLDGGAARAFGPEGVTDVGALSPDGRLVFARFGEKAGLAPLDGGEPKPVPGLHPRDTVVEWTPDMRSLYVARNDRFPVAVDLLDLATGQRGGRSAAGTSMEPSGSTASTSRRTVGRTPTAPPRSFTPTSTWSRA
jgi:Tol biopolymer transport system component